MNVITVLRDPIDVEGFPESCVRSCAGALRLLPGIPVEITADELAHVRALGVPHRLLSEDQPSTPEPIPEPVAESPAAASLFSLPTEEPPSEEAAAPVSVRHRR